VDWPLTKGSATCNIILHVTKKITEHMQYKIYNIKFKNLKRRGYWI